MISRLMTIDIESKLTCFYEAFNTNAILSLNVKPALRTRFPMQMRLTSPFGQFSEWAEGDGEAKLSHNTTEIGDYEICLFAPRPVRVHLQIDFVHPEQKNEQLEKYLDENNIQGEIHHALMSLVRKFYSIKYSIKYYNQISVRDEAMVQSNSDSIQTYCLVFMTSSIVIAIIQVYLVRRMFYVDAKRIRI
ncbi:hypothetical protein WR25_04208 [Diploscapter pachys]|uniref:GOLD domain-containing protein n=1 Tax=Diploscapter pachys TaxID=2018661 RepID=A0A2A2K1K9_9BILA|nr:hypothetical protein WR25_04208 [Diploscapter pachys]